MYWLKVSSATLLSLALITAFGLHSVELKHEHHLGAHTHQHQSGSPDFDIDEYVHGTEQKFFLLILLALLAVGVLLQQIPWQGASRPPASCCLYPRTSVTDHRETNYLLQLFIKGILNPKLH